MPADIESRALAAFVKHMNGCYTGSPKDHPKWSDFFAGFTAALSQQAQEPQPIDRERIMELAVDFAVESLRLGSYEARDLKWKASMIRDKREAAREKLRQALYAAAPAKPAEQEKAASTNNNA